MSTSVHAQTIQVLICLGSGTDMPQLERRLRQEIRALGYIAREDIPCAPQTFEEAKKILEDHRVQGVIGFDEKRENSIIWVWNPRTCQIIRRKKEIDESAKPPYSEIALRIAELLRAAFVELNTAPFPKKESPRSSPVSDTDQKTQRPGAPQSNNGSTGQKVASERRVPPKEATSQLKKKNIAQDASSEKEGTSSFRQQSKNNATPTAAHRGFGTAVIEMLGGATLLSFDYPPTAHLAVGGYWQPGRLVGPELTLFVPLVALHIKEEEGTVDIRKGFLLLGARLAFRPIASRFGLDFSVGVGLDATFVKGDAAPDLKARNTTTFAALPYGRLGLNIVLVGRVAFVGSVLVGTDIPRTRIYIVEESVTKTAPLLLIGLLGIQVEI